MKFFKNKLSFKRCYQPSYKNQKFCLQPTKWISNQRFWLSFVLKAFEFYLESQIPFKNPPCLKRKGIDSDLLNKNHCEKILFASFQGKSFSKNKMNLQVLKENALLLKLYLSK
jgi:hypothetical protein